jgi:transcriptional regulator with XRE-family HTH domain
MEEPATRVKVSGLAFWAKRMAAGLEVKELAQRAGVSDSYVRKIERGSREYLTHDTYQRFRSALRANKTELLAPTEAQTNERK